MQSLSCSAGHPLTAACYKEDAMMQRHDMPEWPEQENTDEKMDGFMLRGSAGSVFRLHAGR
jgi:hypothetical protein